MTGSNPVRRPLLSLVLALAVLLLAAPGASAAAAQADPRDVSLQRLLDAVVASGAPGVVAVVDDGKGTRRLSSGVARVEPELPLWPDARVRVGSTTKTFVATLVLQLVGEGRIGLDDPLGRYLPGVVPDADGITVRQLLSHTSGLFDYSADRAWARQLLSSPHQYRSPASLLAVATAHPPLSAPGEAFHYSNTNYVLAGLLLQRVTGRTVAELLDTRIVRPLHLSGTTFPAGSWQILGYHAHGYVQLPAGADPYDITELNASWASSAGALVSTVEDLQTFYTALLSGRLLRPAQLRVMQQTQPIGPGTSYGLGLMRLDSPCGTTWGHNGIVPGYLTWAFTSPDGRRSAVLTLTSTPTAATNTLWTTAYATAVCQMFGKDLPSGAAPADPGTDRPLQLLG